MMLKECDPLAGWVRTGWSASHRTHPLESVGSVPRRKIRFQNYIFSKMTLLPRNVCIVYTLLRFFALYIIDLLNCAKQESREKENSHNWERERFCSVKTFQNCINCKSTSRVRFWEWLMKMLKNYLRGTKERLSVMFWFKKIQKWFFFFVFLQMISFGESSTHLVISRCILNFLELVLRTSCLHLRKCRRASLLIHDNYEEENKVPECVCFVERM